MSKHTPGPWKTNEQGGILAFNGDYLFCVAAASTTEGVENMHHNARLIAAAPDGLIAAREALAALYGCREVIGSVGNIQHAMDLLTAFIAKAEDK